MIDMHCHIVPGVDDGPDTVEESKQMIEMMYNDGIQAVIATSHRNHPIDFKPTVDYESSLERVKAVALEIHPGFGIYSGAELYVRDGYLDILDSKMYDFTLNKTEYVLIEFPTDADYETISDAVYELDIRGYKPILAHIDKYRALWTDFGLIEKLREDGAYIQITASTLIGKYGKSLKKKMRKLVKEGYVDFIASDGHSSVKRRPLLKRSYRVVSRICSKEEAERIFFANQIAVLEGGKILQREIRKPIFGFFYGFTFASFRKWNRISGDDGGEKAE